MEMKHDNGMKFINKEPISVLQLKPAGYILKPMERMNLLNTIADVLQKGNQ